MYTFYGRCSYDNCVLEEKLLDDCLFCKYHGCMYNSKTGEIEEGPSMHSLQSLELEPLPHRDTQHLYMVHLPDNFQGFHLKTLVPYAPPDFSAYLVYGGQYGFVEFIRLLRQHYYKGKVYLVDPEDQFQWEDEYTQWKNLLGLNTTGITLDEDSLAKQL